nr:hypothetical protein [Tanacetum cinerariifolium]
MKRIIKGQVKSQVKEQVSRILPRIEESVNAQLEAKVLTRSSHSSRTSYAVATDLTEMELKKILMKKMEGNKSTTGTQSRQMSASESAIAEEPVQTTCQMDEHPHPVIETGAEDQPIVHTSQHPEWMFTRSIVIQRRVEDLQLGVKSYQKRLNLTKPDTYRSDLKRREAYTAYSNPKGFIYQNKDKKNRLMRIDELYKFSDGTLNDVRNALVDRLKGIRMQYLPQKIWRKGDKDRAAAMIQAIDKILKTSRIMRSLERFVRGRL